MFLKQGTHSVGDTYRELKGELGLDHFEGRRFRGWHHHVTIALVCFAFIAAERAVAFSPSGRGTRADGAQPPTSGTALPGLVHHDSHRCCACGGDLASPLPALP